MVFFVAYPKGIVGGLFYSHKDNDYMNNYTPKSKVVLTEMNEPII